MVIEVELLRCVCVREKEEERKEGEVEVRIGDLFLVEEIETGLASGTNERTKEYGTCDASLLVLERDKSQLPTAYNLPEETVSTPVAE